MSLSALSVLVVEQSSSEIPEGLMNNPVYIIIDIRSYTNIYILGDSLSFWPRIQGIMHHTIISME